MYTIDASVHISALNPTETNSSTSRAFLTRIRQHQIPLYNPTLLLVEIAAAIARLFGDAERAKAMSAALRGLPHQILVPLDETLADRAARLAADAHLRGADAIYAAVAQQYDAVLVTLDRQQQERLPPLVRTAQPVDLVQDGGLWNPKD